MDSARWGRIVGIFEAVLEAPAGERDALLERLTAEEPELAVEVRRLLQADTAAGGFLEEPAALPPAPTRRLALPATIGRYRVRERIGRGGFGEVFRCLDPQLEREVAVKTLHSDDPELGRRFLREAVISARLDHPGIVRVFDSGRDGDTPYLVQELLAGEDLDRRLASGRLPGLAQRLAWLREVAEALAWAHAAGVVHRDLKPANLRVLPDGHVKVLDFGIAHLEGRDTRLTGLGTVMGTLAYMAPEQVRGEPATEASDVYSFGVVAYELLTSARPFTAESGPALLYQVLESRPRPIRERWPACPPALARLVDRCLAREPARRYAGFGPLLVDLEEVIRQLDPRLPAPVPVAGEGPLRSRLWRRLRSVRWRWLLAAGVATLALAGWLVSRRPERPPPVGATASPPLGAVVIEARPWARILAARGPAGPLDLAGRASFTPALWRLPPGRWIFELDHPRAVVVERCEVEVRPGEVARCERVFARPEVAEFLRRFDGEAEP
ncbi:MAG TPA: serine/threonine-protein kinase [Thermoanaerobaculia bacterium]|nr:serine/threonine-protein kinase [Thermoanaerobaculia bacterium]